MIQNDLNALIATAVKKAQNSGDLPPFDLPPFAVDHPKNPEHGDYSTNIAMQSARLAKMAPFKIAGQIVARLPETGFIGRVDVLPPGFMGNPPKPSATSITIFESFLICNSRVSA